MPSVLIERVVTTRLDIPLAHPITMAFGHVRTQNIVLVRVYDRDGRQGIGEASILGGPHWGEESAEGVQAVIDHYIAPAFVGLEIEGLEQVGLLLGRLIKGNAAARCAVETAILDLLARSMNVSAAQLLGGVCRDRIPVAWTLSTGSVGTDIEEGERAFAEHGHSRFKLKFGSGSPAQDVHRAAMIIRAFEGRASVIADVNQGWDEVTATRWLAPLQDAGLEAIEQPLATADLAGLKRLRSGVGIEIIADESLSSPAAAFAVAAAGGASVFALKPGRDGGPTATRRVAAIADAAGLGLYGGSMLETSVGTAASAALYGSLPNLRLGCELFGPMRLTHDITTAPLRVQNGEVLVPIGPGLGVELDEDKVAFLSTERVGHFITQAAPPARRASNNGSAADHPIKAASPAGAASADKAESQLRPAIT